MSSITLCQYANDTTTISSITTPTCPWNGLAQDDPWISYISSLGYTTSHALLALTTTILTLTSLTKTLNQYRRLTGQITYSDLSEFQFLNVVLHGVLSLLGIVYLAGFVLHVLDMKMGWYILSALCEVLEFGFQLMVVIITFRTWLHTYKFHCTSISSLVVILYIIPSVLYFSVLTAYARRLEGGGVVGLNDGARGLYVALQVLRCIVAGMGFCGAVSRLVAGWTRKWGETEMLWFNIFLSLLTLITTLLSILFTLGILCPNRETGDLWLRLYEWHYFLFFMATTIRMSYSSMREVNEHGGELPSDSDRSMTASPDHTSNRSMSISGSALTAASSLYAQPRHPSTRRDTSSRRHSYFPTDPSPSYSRLSIFPSHRISSLPFPVTTHQPRLPWPQHSQTNHSTAPHPFLSRITLPDLLFVPTATLLAIIISIILITNITTLSTSRDGIPICLLTTYSLITFLQITTNTLGPTEYRPQISLSRSSFQYYKKRIPLALTIIIATIIPFVVVWDWAFLFSSALWPVGVLLVLGTTGRREEGEGIKTFLGSLLGDRKKMKRVHAEMNGRMDYPTTTSAATDAWQKAIHNGLWSFIVVLTTVAFFVSLFNGMYMSLSIGCILLALVGMSKVGRRVGNGWREMIVFWAVGMGIVIGCFLLVIVLPVYVRWRGAGTTVVGDVEAGGVEESAVYITAKKYSNATALSDILEGRNDTVWINIGNELENIKFYADYVCTTPPSFSTIILTSNLPTLLQLNTQTLLQNTTIGLERPIGATSILPLNSKITTTIYPFETLFANPIIVTAEHRRGRQVGVVLRDQTETTLAVRFVRDLGVDVVIATDVEKARGIVGDANSSSMPSNEVSGDTGHSTNTGKTNLLHDASPKTKWTVAAVTSPLIMLLIGNVYLIIRLKTQPLEPLPENGNGISGLHKRFQSMRRSTLTHIIPMDKRTRRIGIGIVECLSIAGWIIFVIGGAQAVDDSQIVSVFLSMAYILGILGTISTPATLLYTWQPKPWILAFSTMVLCLTILSAGYTIHYTVDIPEMGYRLMLTGAATYLGSKAFATFLSNFRYSHLRLEAERGIFVLAVGSLVGWLCLVVGIGRLVTDLGIAVSGIGYYSAAVTVPIAAILLAVSSKQNSRWLSGASASLTTLAIASCGGVIGDTSFQIIQAETTYHYRLMLAGSIITTISLSTTLLIKGWEFESKRSKALRRRLRQQVEEVWDGARTGIAIPPPPRKPVVYISVTQDAEKWFMWRAIAAFSIVGWVISIGGFGATSTSFAEGDVLVAGVMYALCGPAVVALATVALLRDDRVVAVCGGVGSIITFLAVGRFIDVASQWVHDEQRDMAAMGCIIVGSLVYILSTTLLLCLIAHRLVLPPSTSIPLQQQGRRKHVIAICHILLVTGWTVDTAGTITYVRATSTEKLVDIVAPILGSTLTALGIIAYLASRTAIRNVLNPNTITVRQDALPQIILSTIFPLVICLAAATQVGSAIFAAGRTLGSCEDETCGKSAEIRGCRLLISGTVLLALAFMIWIGYGLLNAEHCRVATIREVEERWTGRIERDQHRETESTASLTDSTLQSAPGEEPIRSPTRIPQKHADLHTLLLSWPTLQFAYKAAIIALFFSWTIFIISFGHMRPSSITISLSGHFLFGVSGIISSIALFLWILQGTDQYYWTSIATLTVSLASAGHVFFWSLSQPKPSLASGILVGSLLHSIPALALFTGVLTVRRPRIYPYVPNRELRIRYPTFVFLLGTIAWIIFVIGFWALCDAYGSLPVDSGYAAASVVLIVAGIGYGILYVARMRIERRRVRAMLYGAFAVVFWSASAVFHASCVELAGGISPKPGATGAVMVGTLLYITSQILVIIFRTRAKTDLDITQEEKSLLQWSSNPHHEEEEQHWIHSPYASGEDSKYLIRLFGFIFAAGWPIFIIGLGIWEFEEFGIAREAFDVFAVASVSALILICLRLKVRWISLGWSGTLSAIVALATGGAASFGAAVSSRNTGNAMTLAGCIVALLCLLVIILVLLHREDVEIPRQRAFVYTARVIAAGIILGCILFGAGFAEADNVIGERSESKLLGYIVVIVTVLASIAVGLEIFNLRLATSIIFNRIHLWINNVARWMMENCGPDTWDKTVPIFGNGIRRENNLEKKNRRMSKWQGEEDLSAHAINEVKADESTEPENSMGKTKIVKWQGEENLSTPALIDLGAEGTEEVLDKENNTKDGERSTNTLAPQIVYPFSRPLNVLLAVIGITVSGIPLALTSSERRYGNADMQTRLVLAGSVIFLLSCAAYLALMEVAQICQDTASEDVDKAAVSHANKAPLSSTSASSTSLSASSSAASASSSAASLFLSRPTSMARLSGPRALSSTNLLSPRAFYASESHLGLPASPRIQTRHRRTPSSLERHCSRPLLGTAILEESHGKLNIKGATGRPVSSFLYKSDPHLFVQLPTEHLPTALRLRSVLQRRGHRRNLSSDSDSYRGHRRAYSESDSRHRGHFRTLSDSASHYRSLSATDSDPIQSPMEEEVDVEIARRIRMLSMESHLGNSEQPGAASLTRNSYASTTIRPSPLRTTLLRTRSSGSLLTPRSEQAAVVQVRRLHQRSNSNLASLHTKGHSLPADYPITPRSEVAAVDQVRRLQQRSNSNLASLHEKGHSLPATVPMTPRTENAMVEQVAFLQRRAQSASSLNTDQEHEVTEVEGIYPAEIYESENADAPSHLVRQSGWQSTPTTPAAPRKRYLKDSSRANADVDSMEELEAE